jgi:hypothetical protein
MNHLDFSLLPDVMTIAGRDSDVMVATLPLFRMTFV